MTESQPVEASIKHSLEKNGFPAKVVKLPFKPVYESCKKHGTALAEVLENLKGDNIVGSMEGQHIVFRTPEKFAEHKSAAQAPGADPSWMDNLGQMAGMGSLGDFQSMAQEAFAKMTPSQIIEIKKRIENMSDEEKQNILGMFSQFTNPTKDK